MRIASLFVLVVLRSSTSVRPFMMRRLLAGATIVAGTTVLLSSAVSSIAAPAACDATDLYVNPVPGQPAVSGISPECTFATITAAIEDARERGLGAGARIILSGASAPEPAVLKQERFPLAVPVGVTITTTDDPELGGAGLDAANYVVLFTGRAGLAMELGGGLKGVTLKNERTRNATTMLMCGSGSTEIDAVILEGASIRGKAIAEGLRLRPGCVLDAVEFRVRGFGGAGIIVEAGADLTLDASKVHNNGGDGIVIRGLSSISVSEIALNGGDGVLVDSSNGSTFESNDVRDNAGNGFEVRTSNVSFLANSIHNNSRGTGWDEPQMLFVGPAPSGVQYWTGTSYVTAYAVGIPDGSCDPAVANRIYSYDTADSDEYSVGLYAQGAGGLGAYVWADNNSWRTNNEAENVDQSADSFVDADAICGGIILVTDTDPGTPVE